MSAFLSVTVVTNFPLVESGDDIAALISEAFGRHTPATADGDIVVVAQKIVSKAEGRLVHLKEVTPGAEALDLAQKTGKDARLVEVVLSQSVGVVRYRTNVLIVESRLGFVHANAGIDQSNVVQDKDDPTVLLLPESPDGSARLIRKRIYKDLGVNVAVIVNDSLGRAWRVGTVGQAIGCAGLRAVADLRGTTDLFGRPLEITEVGVADELAAAASLLMGQAAEGCPVAVIRGAGAYVLPRGEDGTGVAALLRNREEDLFRT